MKITETTRRQKTMRDFLNLTHIKTVGIISASNPMGKKLTREENQKLTDEFKDYLKNTQTKYFPVIGKYGTVEQSFMLFNIPLDDLLLWARCFHQESFIYGKVINGNFHFEYYKNVNGKNSYRKTDEADGYVERTKFKDLYTAIFRDFKFQVPFETLGAAIESHDNLINERCEKSDVYARLVEEKINYILNTNYTLKSRCLAKSYIYGSLWNDETEGMISEFPK